MKILYIITQADGGGAQNYTLALAGHFRGAVAAGSESEELFYAAKKLYLPTYRLKHLKRNISPWHDVLATWEIRQLIKTYSPDVVHLNSSKAGILGSFAAMGTKAKVVFTAHGFVFNEPLPFALKSFYLSIEKTASSYRDYIIAVSEADKQSALAKNLIAKEKISVIHNGIGPIDFLDKHAARAALNLPKDKIIVGATSNFYRTKGLDVLAGSIAMLNDDVKRKILVVLIGDGPERENLKSQISNLKLSEIFILLGKIEDPKKCLKAFDVFAMPSRKEGFPYSLLEAMQAALPIVASQTGGIPEALGDAGFLVKPEDPKELAQVLNKIILDFNSHGPGYFTDLSQKTKSRAAGFSKEKMLSETQQVYEKLMK